MNDTSCHIPVLLKEVCEYLQVDRGGVFLDCTLGGGGHVDAILSSNDNNKVIAIDRDLRAIERSVPLIEKYPTRLRVYNKSFLDLNSLDLYKLDGVLADLGVSTDQIKESRGFSFADEEALDMRMDENQALTAANVVNEYPEDKLYIVLKKGGVGKEARKFVKAIIQNRPITSAKELATLISSKAASSKKQTHPATVVFQAIRIEVNQELQQIEALLNSVPEIIAENGRLAVITFHSLEDKLVTKTFRKWAGGGEFSANFPGSRPEKSKGRLITKKPVSVTPDEIEINPSARSARLRVFEFCSE